jgi:hypothetical protein
VDLTPGPESTFEAMLRDPNGQFDRRSELLKPIVEYANAESAAASTGARPDVPHMAYATAAHAINRYDWNAALSTSDVPNRHQREEARVAVDAVWDLAFRAGRAAEACDLEEIRRAARRVCARLVASAHLLDVPFTDAPDQSPWTKAKQDMAALYAAVGINVEVLNGQ